MKALDEESPTIVTPTITTTHQSRPSPSENTAVMNTQSGGAEQELRLNSDEATLPVGKDTEELKSKSPGEMETSMKTRDLDTGKEMPKATRDPTGPEGEDRAGNSVHSVQVESAA